jgi:hypothetical protein
MLFGGVLKIIQGREKKLDFSRETGYGEYEMRCLGALGVYLTLEWILQHIVNSFESDSRNIFLIDLCNHPELTKKDF